MMTLPGPKSLRTRSPRRVPTSFFTLDGMYRRKLLRIYSHISETSSPANLLRLRRETVSLSSRKTRMFSKYSTKKAKTHRHYSKSNQIVNNNCINRKDLIFEEADQNEFVFDAKDMAEIASQKKERFIDKQRTVRKKRNFLCCGINSSIGG
jgi:hypothetical protein